MMTTKRPRLFDLELSDEHMTHVYRFAGLGRFDRVEFETQRGITNWKIANQRAMNARDAAASRHATPDHAGDGTQRPRPAR
jgi:hypothetical protein